MKKTFPKVRLYSELKVKASIRIMSGGNLRKKRVKIIT